MKTLFAAAVLASLSLAACATPPTIYGPAYGPGGIGFVDYRVEPGRYRVTFRGGPGAPPELVADYALLRAADLTLSEGFDWFTVADRFTRQDGAGGGPRLSVGAGGTDFGRRSSVGLGVGTTFNLGGGPAFAQTVEIVMGRGTPPTNADVYNAREVRRAVGART